MKLKIKFANKEVNIKNLVQGAVVLEQEQGFVTPNIYHIHKFVTMHDTDNSVDIMVVDDWGKCIKNSACLTWPI